MGDVEYVAEFLGWNSKQAAAVAQEYKALAGQIGMALIVNSHEDIEANFINTADAWEKIAQEMKARGL